MLIDIKTALRPALVLTLLFALLLGLAYDALYRWCRDARDEKHNWISHQPSRAKVLS